MGRQGDRHMPASGNDRVCERAGSRVRAEARVMMVWGRPIRRYAWQWPQKSMGWLIVVTAALCVVGRHPNGNSGAFAPSSGSCRLLQRNLVHSLFHPAVCGRMGRPARLPALRCKEGNNLPKEDQQTMEDASVRVHPSKPKSLFLNNSFTNAIAGTASSIPGAIYGAPGIILGSLARVVQRPPSNTDYGTPPSPSPTRRFNFNFTAAQSIARMSEQFKQRTQGPAKIKVNSLGELEEQLENGMSVYNLDIRGISQPWRQNDRGELLESFYPLESVLESEARGDGRSEPLKHPVLEAIWTRIRDGSKPGQRTDRYKIGLAIEGGGLRGSVTAGMASAVLGLGAVDAFDMILGSSAGSIIGAYLVGRAQPNTTYDFFCNHLTTSKQKLNGSSWLDMGRLVDLFAPALSNPDKVGGAPMLLDYPMKTLMQELLPVDWETFSTNDKHQPMKIIATGLFTEGPVVLGSQEGSYNDLASLCECVKASCMLPGVAGVEPPWLKGSSALNPSKLLEGREKWMEREFSRNIWRAARDAFTKRARSSSPRGRGNGTSIGTTGIKTVFDRINAGGSGGIDRTELRAALTDIGLNITVSQLDKMFVAADLDRNGVIDYSEFKTLIYSLQSIDANWSNDRWKRPNNWSNQDVEPLVDALIFEPIPYRSAVEYGCTHVLVLRSYPDGKLLPKSLLGLFERLVAPKCLDPFPEVKSHLQSSGHSIVYAEDILRLNEAVANPKRMEQDMQDMEVGDARDIGRYIAAQTAVWGGLIESTSISMSMPRRREPQLLAIAPLDADGEAVSSLELDRGTLLSGIIKGFARVYDMLAPDDMARQRTGYQAAVETYLPIHYKFMNKLAVEDPEQKMKTGTQTLNVKWAKRRRDAAESKNRLEVGDKIPRRWVDGEHYIKSPSATFEKNELVVTPRSDGSLRFARVVGIVPTEVILQVEESPADKNGKDTTPALIFRVEKIRDVGKLDLDKMRDEDHLKLDVETPSPPTPLSRLGIMMQNAAQRFRVRTGVKEKKGSLSLTRVRSSNAGNANEADSVSPSGRPE